MSRAGRIFDRILDITLVIACILVAFMTFSICYDVVMRYFFNRPQIWVDEFSGHILLYVPFLAGAYLLKREGHVSMDFVVGRFSKKTQTLINAVTSVIAILICLVVAWFTGAVAVNMFQTGFLTQTVLRLPEWPIMGIIPLGFFLLFLQFIRRTARLIGVWQGKIQPTRK